MPRRSRCKKTNNQKNKRYIDPDDIFAVCKQSQPDEPPEWYLELQKDPVALNQFFEDLYNWCLRQDSSNFNPRNIPENMRFSKHFDKEIFERTGRFVPLSN